MSLGRIARSALVAALCGALTTAPPVAAAELPASAAPDQPIVLHLPPGAFADDGALGALQITRCRIVLADGDNRSVLQVSPAMAARGFRDLAFTFPPYRQRYDLGLGTAQVQVRIPGSDAADASTTLRSTAFGLRVAGTHLQLEVRFESAGRELIGEYALDGPLTGAVPWQHFLDVQADDLVVTADLPLETRDLLPAVGEVTAQVEFNFALAVSGEFGVTVESDQIQRHVAAAARDGLQALFNAPLFRGALAAAIGAVFLGDPRVAGLPVRRLELAAARDGGLDVLVLTTNDPETRPRVP